MKLSELDSWLINTLNIDNPQLKDYSLNGLQVGNRDQDIKKVATAVDACMAVFEKAVQQKANMLFVHHGLFWGHETAVTGRQYKLLEFLIMNNLSLFACHLPLDLHPVFGNNVRMAQVLGLKNLKTFGRYGSVDIGFSGEFEHFMTLENVINILFPGEEKLTVFPFGPGKIKSVGIISGGASKEVEEAVHKGFDLYITGESLHQMYHFCLESGINVIHGGHYNTETWGVRRIAEEIDKTLGLETCFIDYPTGL